MHQEMQLSGKEEKPEDDWFHNLVNRPSMRVKHYFSEYMFEKNYAKASHHLTKEDYVKIPWMNVVPEIVCDVLGYLCNYVHYRTDKLSKYAYEDMLQGQVRQMKVMTEQ
mmetsp:Transcript_20742/g.24346  ORF Transcript_20742/g.24346 Transcript_20742/m.24346 type:complete len:109 (-) Transcript_20742:503-829(-)